MVKVTRQHNNANILSLGVRFMNEDEAKDAVRIFLETKFSNDERHVKRINKLDQRTL
jgi:ribose 5-phosphate isomerase B